MQLIHPSIEPCAGAQHSSTIFKLDSARDLDPGRTLRLLVLFGGSVHVRVRVVLVSGDWLHLWPSSCARPPPWTSPSHLEAAALGLAVDRAIIAHDWRLGLFVEIRLALYCYYLAALAA